MGRTMREQVQTRIATLLKRYCKWELPLTLNDGIDGRSRGAG